ncbi:hypothetical protein PI125_g22375 [Phytophthora idaei]|nr:hypothetical protein PI125_g22375 [Phytophthora idaei]
MREKRAFKAGDRVWMHRPPRGPQATKFVHPWVGPMKIVEDAGYDNFLLQREDGDQTGEQIIAHVSFLITYHYPEALLNEAAADIASV